jgi:excisionase family DNA binding protein
MERLERILLKPEEAALALGISRAKLYALLAAGVLPSIRLGASLRIPTAALAAWVNEQLGGVER